MVLYNNTIGLCLGLLRVYDIQCSFMHVCVFERICYVEQCKEIVLVLTEPQSQANGIRLSSPLEDGNTHARTSSY